MVFEGFSFNLREVLNKFGRSVGLSIDAVRSYSRQMLNALYHMGKARVIHQDLKPDNILVSADFMRVKICDLGSGLFESDGDRQPTPYLVSRFYRAPEIILGLDYDRGVDTWSIGVTVFELCAGRVMFPGADNGDMLGMMQKVLGPVPRKMIKRHLLAFRELGLEDKRHFNDSYEFLQRGVDKATQTPTVTPTQILQSETPLKSVLSKATQKADRKWVPELTAFISMMLTMDEKRRPAVETIMKEAEFVKKESKD